MGILPLEHDFVFEDNEDFNNNEVEASFEPLRPLNQNFEDIRSPPKISPDLSPSLSRSSSSDSSTVESSPKPSSPDHGAHNYQLRERTPWRPMRTPINAIKASQVKVGTKVALY